jgi:hypothetical protein
VDQFRIFISYTHEDGAIASALEGLFILALGPAVHVFRDETSISYGGDIKREIVEELERADVLVALIADGQPASPLNWVGYELATFESAWRKKQEQADAEKVKQAEALKAQQASPQQGAQQFHAKQREDTHNDPSNDSIIGKVVVLCSEEVSLGPQTGRRPVKLGIPTNILSEPDTAENSEGFAGCFKARPNSSNW